MFTNAEEGLNTVGFVVVNVAWLAGVLALVVGWWDVGRVDPAAPMGQPPPAWTLAALAASAVIGIASLLLPWIEGPAAATGDTLVESGFGGLDPLSVLLVLVLAASIVSWVTLPTRRGRRKAVALQAYSSAAVLAGNVLIQATTVRGSFPRYGAWVGLGASLSLVATATAHQLSFPDRPPR